MGENKDPGFSRSLREWKREGLMLCWEYSPGLELPVAPELIDAAVVRGGESGGVSLAPSVRTLFDLARRDHPDLPILAQGIESPESAAVFLLQGADGFILDASLFEYERRMIEAALAYRDRVHISIFNEDTIKREAYMEVRRSVIADSRAKIDSFREQLSLALSPEAFNEWDAAYALTTQRTSTRPTHPGGESIQDWHYAPLFMEERDLQRIILGELRSLVHGENRQPRSDRCGDMHSIVTQRNLIDGVIAEIVERLSRLGDFSD